MIVDHATRFCDALSEDFGHRSREQSLVTDIAGSVAPINPEIKHVDAWAAREKRKVQFLLGMLGERAWVDRKSTRLNSGPSCEARMTSSARTKKKCTRIKTSILYAIT